MLFWGLFFGTGSQPRRAPKVDPEVNPEVGGVGGMPPAVAQGDCLVNYLCLVINDQVVKACCIHNGLPP